MLASTSIAWLAQFATEAHAAITEFEVKSRSAYGQFQAGEFVRLEGELKGELSPEEGIPGIKQAARNERGQVPYRSKFVMIMPVLGAKANGTLLIDVPNRGRPITHFLFNSAREKFQPLDLEARTGFLQHQGFGVAMVQWELGQGIELPSFKNAAGETLFVEGVGLAAIRDFAIYLRSNAIANPIQRVLGVGYSQTARLLKSLYIEGFNEASGVRAFDGFHLHASASGIADVLTTGKGPASSTFFTPRFTHPEHRGVTEEPVAYRDIVSRAQTKAPGGKPAPLLLVTMPLQIK